MAGSSPQFLKWRCLEINTQKRCLLSELSEYPQHGPALQEPGSTHPATAAVRQGGGIPILGGYGTQKGGFLPPPKQA